MYRSARSVASLVLVRPVLRPQPRRRTESFALGSLRLAAWQFAGDRPGSRGTDGRRGCARRLRGDRRARCPGGRLGGRGAHPRYVRRPSRRRPPSRVRARGLAHRGRCLHGCLAGFRGQARWNSSGSGSLPAPRGGAVRWLDGYLALPFARASAFFQRRLSERGYLFVSGDAEPPLEAEARFAGQGTSGGWKVNSVPGCARLVAFEFWVDER